MTLNFMHIKSYNIIIREDGSTWGRTNLGTEKYGEGSTCYRESHAELDGFITSLLNCSFKYGRTDFSKPTCFHPFLPLYGPILSVFFFYHWVSEVQNCQRAYFYQRFPILHSDSGEQVSSFIESFPLTPTIYPHVIFTMKPLRCPSISPNVPTCV